MFETGQGGTAYDTSGVTPAADLTLSGNVTWAGGWGITLGMGGKAQASTSASQKIANMIQGSGEYTLEAWVAPANVTQTNAYIVSYSGSNTTRDATLGQAATQYQGMARSSTTDTNGMPALLTTTADGAAQAALQHVVLTYDPVNGQKIYVNGVYTGDADPSKGGTLANWDSTFALVLGNETTGQRQWQGTIKFVAIHNRALTPAQIQQNFAAGVGQKYFLLFGVSQLTGVPQSYILFQAAQYDTYSYLFAQPKFISLDPTATIPPNLKLSGMRIGVNGQLAQSGQSFTYGQYHARRLAYTAANGQLLSNLGGVVPATLGPSNDLFFLAFDQLGSSVHAYVEPPVTIPVRRCPRTTPQPDVGVTTFERATPHHVEDHRRAVHQSHGVRAVQHDTAVDALLAADLGLRVLGADGPRAAGRCLLRAAGEHRLVPRCVLRQRPGCKSQQHCRPRSSVRAAIAPSSRRRW